jgi:hypothetical protein
MTASIATAYTVQQYAERMNVKPPLVLDWISKGSLQAVDVSSMPG